MKFIIFNSKIFKTCFKLFYIIILNIVVKYSTSDIPTHCIQQQVVGVWRISRTITMAKKKLSLTNSNLCGHELPSNIATSIKARDLSTSGLKIKDYIYVTLKEDNTAVIEGYDQKAFWTMIYDEGFEVYTNKTNINEKISYFFFLKYDLNHNDKTDKGSSIESKYSSYCYVTLNGWYNEGNNEGCAQGFKVSSFGSNDINDNPTNGEVENKQNVTESSAVKQNNISFIEEKNTSYLLNNDILPLTIVLNKELNIHKLIEEKNSLDIYNNNLKQQYSKSNFLELQSNEELNNVLPNNFKNNKVFDNLRFTELKDQIILHSKFKDHHKFVKRINSADLSWKAKNYKELKGKTISDINDYLKNKKSELMFNSTKYNKLINNTFNSKNNFINNLLNSNKLNRVKKLRSKNKFDLNKNNKVLKFKEKLDIIRSTEDSIDYSELMNEPRSQGNCGSCYADSTVSVLEARIKIKYKILDFKISVDHILECSIQNQGCDGGYSYLVGKFANENALVNNDCYDKNGKCVLKKECENNKQSILYVKDYYYIGDFYGNTNEKEIIKDLRENGPLIISFEPDYAFMNYKSGIYKNVLNNAEVINDTDQKKLNLSSKKLVTNKPKWTKVDHSVVLVGYGVDKKGVPYWKCMNSWGKDWGEDGFFRILRGSNHLSIESLAEGLIPIFKN